LATTKYLADGHDGFECFKGKEVSLEHHEHDLHMLDAIILNFFANTRKDLKRRISSITEALLETRLSKFGGSRGVEQQNWSPDGEFVVLNP
jgi:hypothetical protein